MDRTGFRMGASGRRERVDDDIDWTHITCDHGQRLLFDIVREGIAIDIARIKTGGARGLGDGDGIVPARCCGTAFLGGSLKKDAESCRSRAECGGDARGETEASGGPDDQDVLWAALDRALGLYVVDLLLDVRG